MGTTHISLFKGYANQVLAQTTNPTDRELAEYEVGNTVGLEDGDWYYNTSTNTLLIRIASSWYMIGFQAQ